MDRDRASRLRELTSERQAAEIESKAAEAQKEITAQALKAQLVQEKSAAELR